MELRHAPSSSLLSICRSRVPWFSFRCLRAAILQCPFHPICPVALRPFCRVRSLILPHSFCHVHAIALDHFRLGVLLSLLFCLQRLPEYPDGDGRLHIAHHPNHGIHILDMSPQHFQHTIEFDQIHVEYHADVVHQDCQDIPRSIAPVRRHDPIGIPPHALQLLPGLSHFLPFPGACGHRNLLQLPAGLHQPHDIGETGDIRVYLPFFPEIGQDIIDD